MIKILIFIAVIIGSALSTIGILAAYKSLNIKKSIVLNSIPIWCF